MNIEYVFFIFSVSLTSFFALLCVKTNQRRGKKLSPGCVLNAFAHSVFFLSTIASCIHFLLDYTVPVFAQKLSLVVMVSAVYVYGIDFFLYRMLRLHLIRFCAQVILSPSKIQSFWDAIHATGISLTKVYLWFLGYPILLMGLVAYFSVYDTETFHESGIAFLFSALVGVNVVFLL